MHGRFSHGGPRHNIRIRFAFLFDRLRPEFAEPSKAMARRFSAWTPAGWPRTGGLPCALFCLVLIDHSSTRDEHLGTRTLWALGEDRFSITAPGHEQLVTGFDEAEQAADALAERFK
jgi:hypothetical protein